MRKNYNEIIEIIESKALASFPQDVSPRFKRLIKNSLFILFVYSWPLAGEATWPYIWEGVQFEKQKQLSRKRDKKRVV